MEAITRYRPVGLKELELISDANYQAFPPRLFWQPVFYPVLNEAYAAQIASEWNTKDEFSGYCGVVMAFDLNKEYFLKYDVQNVGSEIHNELWIPAEELEIFNQNIVGSIRITKAFFGEAFTFPKNDILTQKLIAIKNGNV